MGVAHPQEWRARLTGASRILVLALVAWLSAAFSGLWILFNTGFPGQRRGNWSQSDCLRPEGAEHCPRRVRLSLAFDGCHAIGPYRNILMRKLLRLAKVDASDEPLQGLISSMTHAQKNCEKPLD
jgi:hypothetical protein